MNTIIREYIKSAMPVSSKLLEKKHDFGLSPAAIRIEMQKLTDAGFISQPHTSAGRVPTDKGYRFFVNNLLLKENKTVKGEENEFSSSPFANAREINDNFRFIQALTRQLAEETKTLALNYLEDENVFWQEGWEGVLQEPEFEERDNVINFTELLKGLEKGMEKLEAEEGVNVYIGKENRLPGAKDFTVITSRYHLRSGEEGIISILGPKRMEYDKNINLINSLLKLLE